MTEEKPLSTGKSATYMREWIERPGNREKKREMNRRYYERAKASGKIGHDNAERNRFRKHNTTKEAFLAMIEAQGGGCALCGRVVDWQKMTVDHDHACCPGQFSCGKCIRGALCKGCNGALGVFNDDIELLRKAQDYVMANRSVLNGS